MGSENKTVNGSGFLREISDDIEERLGEDGFGLRIMLLWERLDAKGVDAYTF